MTTSPPESETYRDRVTGATVRRLTGYLAHSYHLYFTNPGWWDGNRRLVFGSDRGNGSNLYSIELVSGEITTLTDSALGDARSWQNAYVNPVRDEMYAWRGDELMAVDLGGGGARVIAKSPPGWTAGNESVTADGNYVVCAMRQDVNVGPLNLGAGYVGFRELFEAHPLCRIVRTSIDTGETETLHEEQNWLGHVNASPALPHVLTYCYEGPWDLVGQRIWGLDTSTGRTWKIRPQKPGEMVGHEYWMDDGRTVGYHGKTRAGAGGEGFFGFADYNGEPIAEMPFPHDSHHFHSNTPELIVADGPAEPNSPYVLLSRLVDGVFDGPRVLCTHRSSRHTQHLHVHPRLSPDGTQVLFTADPTGYGQLFLADVPPFESLPALDQVP